MPKPIVANDRFIRAKEAAKLLGISLTQFYRKVECGDYPQPIKLSERASVWPLSQMNTFMDKVKKNRKVEPGAYKKQAPI